MTSAAQLRRHVPDVREDRGERPGGAPALPAISRRRSRASWAPRAIKWNFTKFLVGRDGEVIDRFAPAMTPEQIEKRVVALLKTRGAAVPKDGGTGRGNKTALPREPR